jgi:midasin (ATPase involved in ribosome maturation)
MKNLKTTMVMLLVTSGLGLGLYSCKKDVAATPVTVTEADAAELTTNAVVPTSGGFAVQVNSSVSIYKNVALSCGVKKDSTISKSSASGVTPAYSYNLSWNYMLTCAGIVPSQLTFNFTGSSTYDGPRMSSDDKSTGGFVLTNLQPTASTYTLSSTYVRNGTQTSKIARKYTFTSNLSITSSNVAVDKTTLKIVSGTAAVTLNGTSSSGKSFSFSGTITFLGNNKANLVLNSGASYAINW